MRILIIGCNGFLGQALYQYLVSLNFDVFGTSHQESADNKVFKLSVGDDIDENILNKNMDAVVYLTHIYEKEKSLELVRWYKKTFLLFEKVVKKQIYLSSYSANKLAVSSYGQVKYEVENFFISNNGYAISPGLIVGNGGIYNKIKKFIMLSPMVVVPVNPNKNLLPIVSIENVCFSIKKLLDNEYDRRNYNIFTELLSLETLVNKIITDIKKRRLIFRINANFVLKVMKSFESLGIVLPVSSDSLSGFIANQNYTAKNDSRLLEGSKYD